MRVLPALFTTIAALPISSCEDFDAVAALANYGVNASNFVTGGSRASIAGSLAENDLAAREENSGCKYAVRQTGRASFNSRSVLTGSLVWYIEFAIPRKHSISNKPSLSSRGSRILVSRPSGGRTLLLLRT